LGQLLDAVAGVVGRPVRVIGGRTEGFERIHHGAMQEAAAGREEPLVGHVADPVMGEVQQVAVGLEHVMANHLLDRFRDVALVHAAGGPEEGEVEAPPDDRGHRGHLLAARAEPVEPAGHQLADARGQGQRRGLLGPARQQPIVVDGAHGLQHHEGIALAHGPDALLHSKAATSTSTASRLRARVWPSTRSAEGTAAMRARRRATSACRSPPRARSSRCSPQSRLASLSREWRWPGRRPR
jgi:hypothetical protein